MLISRSPTCIACSDAAHTGLGGWCKEFSFVWRLTRNDMVIAGFPMKELDTNFQELDRWTPKEQLPDRHDNLLHINTLEFLAIIINVWLCLYFIKRRPPNEGGHHVLVRADNTSAISCTQPDHTNHPYVILLTFCSLFSWNRRQQKR